MAQHNKLGKEGEQAACEFLIARGLTIRETNWRMPPLEIDIVAQEQGILHVIEVKTRAQASPHYDPMEAITPAKVRNLVRAANGYIALHNLPLAVQYDVMILIGKAPHFEINHIPHAFEPPLRTIR